MCKDTVSFMSSARFYTARHTQCSKAHCTPTSPGCSKCPWIQHTHTDKPDRGLSCNWCPICVTHARGHGCSTNLIEFGHTGTSGALWPRGTGPGVSANRQVSIRPCYWLVLSDNDSTQGIRYSRWQSILWRSRREFRAIELSEFSV